MQVRQLQRSAMLGILLFSLSIFPFELWAQSESPIVSPILLERVIQGPGVISSPSLFLYPGESVLVRLNVSAATWDAKVNGKPAVFLDLRIEVESTDCGSWEFTSGASMVGGARTKDGKMPAVTITNDGTPRQFRVTLALNSRIGIGLNLEEP